MLFSVCSEYFLFDIDIEPDFEKATFTVPKEWLLDTIMKSEQSSMEEAVNFLEEEYTRMDIQKELKGTSVGTAYMITHTLIKDHILKTFSNVYVREAYYGKVGQRRYDLRNINCDTCKVKSCSTKQKKDKDTFFCIRIDL